MSTVGIKLLLESTSTEETGITTTLDLSSTPTTTMMLTKMTFKREAITILNQTDQVSSFTSIQNSTTLVPTPIIDSSSSTKVIKITDKSIMPVSTTHPDLTGKQSL